MNAIRSAGGNRSSLIYSQIIYIHVEYLPYASVILLEVYSVRSFLKKHSRSGDFDAAAHPGTQMGGVRASGPPPDRVMLFQISGIPPRSPEPHRAVCSEHRLHRTYVTAVQGFLTVFDRLCLGNRGGMPRLTDMTDRREACSSSPPGNTRDPAASWYAFVVMSKRTRAGMYSVIVCR